MHRCARSHTCLTNAIPDFALHVPAFVVSLGSSTFPVRTNSGSTSGERATHQLIRGRYGKCARPVGCSPLRRVQIPILHSRAVCICNLAASPSHHSSSVRRNDTSSRLRAAVRHAVPPLRDLSSMPSRYGASTQPRLGLATSYQPLSSVPNSRWRKDSWRSRMVRLGISCLTLSSSRRRDSVAK